VKYQSHPTSTTAPPKPRVGTRLAQFWKRVTDGLELNQLWNQFRSEARASYRLYSREVTIEREPGVRPRQHWWAVTKQLFWAILEKLSPARRVVLLIALVLLLFNPQVTWIDKGGTHAIGLDLRLWGGLLILTLLVLEIADRVVMKRDLQIARDIQRWLLPSSPPQVPTIEIAFATRPANTVAGDYYDVFARPPSPAGDEAFCIAVADVSGKSIPAALLMATFQASLRTLSATASSLESLLDGMNRYTCNNSQGGLRFTTAFIAEYRPNTRQLTYINAGHNPPMLRRESGAIERLEVGGLPLGIMGDASYRSATVTLGPGDWVIAFTDGVIEAENTSQAEYGEERLKATVNSGPDLRPDRMLSRIMVDVDRYVGDTPQHDDITLLLIKAL
jgi:serine phosphatase RsbU (regulator of sigma subunit)